MAVGNSLYVLLNMVYVANVNFAVLVWQKVTPSAKYFLFGFQPRTCFYKTGRIFFLNTMLQVVQL